MKNLKTALLLFLLLLSYHKLIAQAIVNKGDMIIHIINYDAWGNHKFFVNVYKYRNSVKIVYAYRDSIKYSEIRKDPAYRPLASVAFRYKSTDSRGQVANDNLTNYFDQHSDYTKDSVIVDIKRDTLYKNLLTRIAQTSEAELKRKHDDIDVLDGDFPSFIIIAKNETKKAWAHSPKPQSYPVLYSLLHNTMETGKELKAVNKIRKYYRY